MRSSPTNTKLSQRSGWTGSTAFTRTVASTYASTCRRRRTTWRVRAKRRTRSFLGCKNTKLASLIYGWLAEGETPPGIPEADLASVRNENGERYTIRVDSKVIGETEVEGSKGDETRWMRFTLDTVGKRDWSRDPQGR